MSGLLVDVWILSACSECLTTESRGVASGEVPTFWTETALRAVPSAAVNEVETEIRRVNVSS